MDKKVSISAEELKNTNHIDNTKGETDGAI